jgi:hypothetical protein
VPEPAITTTPAQEGCVDSPSVLICGPNGGYITLSSLPVKTGFQYAADFWVHAVNGDAGTPDLTLAANITFYEQASSAMQPGSPLTVSFHDTAWLEMSTPPTPLAAADATGWESSIALTIGSATPNCFVLNYAALEASQ